MRKSFVLYFAFFILHFALPGCDRPLPDVLIVLPEADNYKQFYVRGMDQITYRIKKKFPAQEVINQIARALKDKGCVSVDELYLQPNTLSSSKIGWIIYEDKRLSSTTYIYEWSANWRDAKRNLVVYTFRYKDSARKYQQKTYILKPASSDLIVVASYVPARLADEIRLKAIEKAKKAKKSAGAHLKLNHERREKI